MMYLILGILILPAIIYFTVRGAVEEATFQAMIRYDKYKNATKDTDA